jgi:hypothetical protein
MLMMTMDEMDQAMIHPSAEFTKSELEAMHSYCLKYRDLVRGGGMPTPYQNIHFMLYQTFCYVMGVACE